jgi:hypothetical protein
MPFLVTDFEPNDDEIIYDPDDEELEVFDTREEAEEMAKELSEEEGVTFYVSEVEAEEFDEEDDDDDDEIEGDEHDSDEDEEEKEKTH